MLSVEFLIHSNVSNQSLEEIKNILPPFNIVGGIVLDTAGFVSYNIIGEISKEIKPENKNNENKIFLELKNKRFDLIKALNPTEEKIIREIEPKSSNLINVELIKIPDIPKIIANIKNFSFWNVVLVNFKKIIHIPNPPKMISIVCMANDCFISGVWCSDTESTRGSLLVRNGFMAL